MDDHDLSLLFTSCVEAADRAASSLHVRDLVWLVSTHRRDLVFFVGAGASMAGDTGMPSTSKLLQGLTAAALCRLAAFDRLTADRMLDGINPGSR